MYSLSSCRVIELPKITDPRGNLTFIEGGGTFPLISNVSITSMMFPAAPSEAAMGTKPFIS